MSRYAGKDLSSVDLSGAQRSGRPLGFPGQTGTSSSARMDSSASAVQARQPNGVGSPLFGVRPVHFNVTGSPNSSTREVLSPLGSPTSEMQGMFLSGPLGLPSSEVRSVRSNTIGSPISGLSAGRSTSIEPPGSAVQARNAIGMKNSSSSEARINSSTDASLQDAQGTQHFHSPYPPSPTPSPLLSLPSHQPSLDVSHIPSNKESGTPATEYWFNTQTPLQQTARTSCSSERGVRSSPHEDWGISPTPEDHQTSTRASVGDNFAERMPRISGALWLHGVRDEDSSMVLEVAAQVLSAKGEHVGVSPGPL